MSVDVGGGLLPKPGLSDMAESQRLHWRSVCLIARFETEFGSWMIPMLHRGTGSECRVRGGEVAKTNSPN